MELFHTIRLDSRLLALLSQLLDVGRQILAKEIEMATSLQDIVDAVANESTAIAGLQTFITGLQTQIAGVGMSATQQAQIDAIFSSVNQNAASITAAMAMGVPSTPPPVVVPPVT